MTRYLAAPGRPLPCSKILERRTPQRETVKPFSLDAVHWHTRCISREGVRPPGDRVSTGQARHGRWPAIETIEINRLPGRWTGRNGRSSPASGHCHRHFHHPLASDILKSTLDTRSGSLSARYPDIRVFVSGLAYGNLPARFAGKPAEPLIKS